MKAVLIIIIIAQLTGPAYAEPWHFDRAQDNPGALIAGFFSGYAVHELGHIFTAESMGFNYEFEGVTIVYPGSQMTSAERLQVSSAGFQAQWRLSEAALRYRENNVMTGFSDSYNAGLVIAHLAITAAYLTALLNHEDGDIEGISNVTGKSNTEQALLFSIPAILDAWRLFGKNVPKWVPTLSVGSKAIAITSIWTY